MPLLVCSFEWKPSVFCRLFGSLLSSHPVPPHPLFLFSPIFFLRANSQTANIILVLDLCIAHRSGIDDKTFTGREWQDIERPAGVRPADLDKIFVSPDGTRIFLLARGHDENYLFRRAGVSRSESPIGTNWELVFKGDIEKVALGKHLTVKMDKHGRLTVAQESARSLAWIPLANSPPNISSISVT